MAAKMAATNLILTYLCSAIRYKGKESVHAVIVWTVRRGDQLFEAQEQQLSCIFSKMAAKMAAENMNLMYLSSAFRYKDRWRVQSYEVDNDEFSQVEINNNIIS